MQRKYIRATVGESDADIPIGLFVANQYCRYVGGVLITEALPEQLVFGPLTGGATDNAIARWDTASGRLLQNSVVAIDDAGAMTGVTSIGGVPVTDFVRGPTPAVAVDNHIATWDLTSGRLIQDSGLHIGDVVYNFDAEAVTGHIPMFFDSTGRRLTDSGLIAANVVQNTSASTDNAVARFDGATGKFIQNSVVIIADTTGDVTGLGTLNTRTIDRWVDGPVSTGLDTAVAIWDNSGVDGRLLKYSTVFIDVSGNITGVTTINGLAPGDVVGPASATDNAVARFNLATGKLIQNSVVIIADTTGDVTGLGTLNTRTIANWVDGPASAPAGNVAYFSNTSGKLIGDSGLVAVNVTQSTTVLGAGTDNAVARWDSTFGRFIQNSGVIISDTNNVTGLGTLNTRTIANWVDGPASATDEAVARFDSTTGKLIQNSVVAITDAGAITGASTINGTNISQLVTSATSSVANLDIVLWSGTNGRVLTNSGVQWNRIAHVPTPFFTDNAVVRTDLSANTYTVQQSSITISDTGDIAGVTAINSIAIANYAITSSGNSIGRVPVYNSGTSITQSQVVISTGGVVSAVSTLNGIDPATWVVGPASATSGRVAVYNGTTGKLLQDGTKLEADLVAGPASATSGRVAVYNGTTGKLLQNGTKLEASLVEGPAVATDNSVARYDATTGKLIQGSNVIVDDSGNITGAGTYNGIAIHDQYFDASSNGGTGTTPKSTVYTATKTGRFNVMFLIWYNVGDTGSNIVVTTSTTAAGGFNHAVVSCGAQGGQITSNGGSGTLLTGTSGLPNVPPIPSTGLIFVFVSQDIIVGETITVAITATGAQHNVAEGALVAFEC